MAKKDTNPNRKVKKPGEQRRQLRQIGNKEEKIEKRKKIRREEKRIQKQVPRRVSKVNNNTNIKISRVRNTKFNIAQIAFMLVFIYMCYLVISYMLRDKIRFYEVIAGSIVEDTSHTGLIIRSESVKNTDAAGTINYFVREAKHVAVGQPIYSVDGTGSLTKFIKENNLEGLNISDSDYKKLKNDLSLFSTSYKDINFNEVYDTKYLLNSSLLEYANVASLDGLEDKLKAENIQYNQVVSDEAGLVSFVVDGKENLELTDINKESFDTNKYSAAYIKAGQQVDAGTPIYKLVNSEEWSMVFAIGEKEQKEYEDRTSLNIKFNSKDLELKAKYSTFTGSDGLTYGKLDFDKYVINFLSDRYVDFEIEAKKANGLKIPKKTVLEKEFYTVPASFITKGGNSTDLGFNKEIYGESGTSVQFVTVDIYGLVDDKYYISMADDSSLKAGDYIVAEGTNERFQIGEKASLQGVYNINKGYAVFKNIEILASNDEYYTVAKGTRYGLNVYDHILLNPNKVEDKQFIYQ